HCTAGDTGSAKISGLILTRVPGSALTSLLPVAGWPSSWTAASGTPARSTGATRRSTSGTGRRNSAGPWSATVRRTRRWPRPGGGVAGRRDLGAGGSQGGGGGRHGGVGGGGGSAAVMLPAASIGGTL